MSNHNDSAFGLLKSLAGLIYEHISPDVRFRNQRIDEWLKSLPPIVPSMTDSTDADALNEIARLHRELECMDEKHTVIGYQWGGFEVKTFSRTLEQMGQKIQSSSVDSSVYNLYHVHRAVLLRAQGNYTEALVELEKSTVLLQRKIATHPHYLPRYNREIIMNDGIASELHRINGHIATAIQKVDDMRTSAKEGGFNREFADEDARAQCPIASWALYFGCEAHLAVKDWESVEAERAREAIFTETFSSRAYKHWTMPVLIRIIGNKIWKDRYPHYFNDIANLVYVGTAGGKAKALMREASVHCGRIRLKPATSLVAIVALMAQASAAGTSPSPAPGDSIPLKSFQQVIEMFIKRLPGGGQDFSPATKDLVVEQLNRALEQQAAEEKGQDLMIAADRGVGIGLTDAAHLQLPLFAFAEDRGVGVG